MITITKNKRTNKAILILLFIGGIMAGFLPMTINLEDVLKELCNKS